MGLGRLIGKAATGAAPIAIQKWRDDVDTKRDAQLQKYRREENASNQAFQSGENKLSREQDQSQHASTLAQDQTQFEATNKNQADQLTLETSRVNKLMEQIDLEMKSTSLDIGKKEALEKLQTALAEAESPEQQISLITRIMGMDGKERDPDWDFIEGTAIDPESAEKISTLIRTNDRTGEWEFLGAGADTSAAGPGAAASAIPQEAIDLFLSDPSEEAAAELEEAFPGQASRYVAMARNRSQTPQGQPAANPTQQAVAATGLLDMGMGRAQQQRLPPGGGVRRPGAAPAPQQREPATIDNETGNVLEGYTLPGPTLGDQIAGAARKVGEYQRGATASNQENKVNTVVDNLKTIVTSKDLRPLVRVPDEDIELAIASGKLPDAYVKVLQAYLEQ